MRTIATGFGLLDGNHVVNVVRSADHVFDVCDQVQFQWKDVNGRQEEGLLPRLGNTTFHVMENNNNKNIISDRKVWKNSHDVYISYINVGAKGTWIVGNAPGVDDGFMYIRPKENSFSPLHWEQSVSWKVNVDKTWVDDTSLSLVCLSRQRQRQSNDNEESILKKTFIPDYRYYQIQHFQSSKTESTTSYLSERTVDKNIFGFSRSNQFTTYSAKDLSVIKNHTSFQYLFGFGDPVVITNTATATTITARLVNHEYGADDSWRLTFRKLHLNNQQLPDENVEVEIFLHGNGNTTPKSQFRPLVANEQTNHQLFQQHSLESLELGSYLWLWHEKSMKNNHMTRRQQTEEVVLKCVAKAANTWLFQIFPADRRDQLEQSIVRRDAELMRLSLHTDNHCDNNNSGSKNKHFELSLTLESITQPFGVRNNQDDVSSSSFSYTVVDFEVIGRNPLPMIVNYLTHKDNNKHINNNIHNNNNNKEKEAPLSPCYFYHAGVSLPAPFVYAGELVCVLLGAKPLAMIQFTSDTDASWKFPLVSELVTAMVSNVILTQQQQQERQQGVKSMWLDVRYAVFTYKEFETLVVYRQQQQHIADELLPHHQAQALHPLPFPDTKQLEQDYREQIYNAAWNGLLLGYPRRFVRFYCESFHNDLTVNDKVALFEEARVDLQHRLHERYNMEIEVIGFHSSSKDNNNNNNNNNNNRSANLTNEDWLSLYKSFE